MKFKNLLKWLSELDMYFTGRTLSKEDRAKALQQTIETNRGRFGYTRKMYNSLCGESFITLENKYVRYISFLGERDVPVKSTLRKYDENGRSVKKSVLFLSGGHEIEFNPAFEI
jgi:hypothetical protein